jgi:hypothetical protein
LRHETFLTFTLSDAVPPSASDAELAVKIADDVGDVIFTDGGTRSAFGGGLGGGGFGGGGGGDAGAGDTGAVVVDVPPPQPIRSDTRQAAATTHGLKQAS